MDKRYLKNLAKASLEMNFTLSGDSPTRDSYVNYRANQLNMGLDVSIGAGIGYVIGGPKVAVIGMILGLGYGGLKPAIVDTIRDDVYLYRRKKKLKKEAKRREMEKPEEKYTKEELIRHWYV